MRWGVSTLAVEWIEMRKGRNRKNHTWVSTLAVEWIEIYSDFSLSYSFCVSTLAVEWIEMTRHMLIICHGMSLHPRGGVD